MKKRIYKFIFYKLMKWEIINTIDDTTKKCVMIVVPHTSWHDFYIGVFTRGIINKEMNFVGKKELFTFPFGYYFKWMGGEPLNRKKNENKVESIARIFEKKEEFRLAIAPEGTRKKVSEWKTGYYYIALKAKVPILTIAFDWKNKKVIIGEPFYPTGNYEIDSKYLESQFIGINGKIPEYSFEKKY